MVVPTATVKRLGHRTGNWLSVQQGQLLLDTTDPGTLLGRRDAAMLALLLDADCDGRNWWRWTSATFSNGKSIGRLSIL